MCFYTISIFLSITRFAFGRASGEIRYGCFIKYLCRSLTRALGVEPEFQCDTGQPGRSENAHQKIARLLDM